MHSNTQRGVTLIMSLLMLVVMTLLVVSVARLTRAALSVSGNLSQAQVLAMSNDQAMMLAKTALLAVNGTVEVAAAGQSWFNTGTGSLVADFWQHCDTASGGATRCATPAAMSSIGGQSITLKYIVRATPSTYTYSYNTTDQFGHQLVGKYYQIFTNATTASGASASATSWYLKI